MVNRSMENNSKLSFLEEIKEEILEGVIEIVEEEGIIEEIEEIEVIIEEIEGIGEIEGDTGVVVQMIVLKKISEDLKLASIVINKDILQENAKNVKLIINIARKPR